MVDLRSDLLILPLLCATIIFPIEVWGHWVHIVHLVIPLFLVLLVSLPSFPSLAPNPHQLCRQPRGPPWPSDLISRSIREGRDPRLRRGMEKPSLWEPRNPRRKRGRRSEGKERMPWNPLTRSRLHRAAFRCLDSLCQGPRLPPQPHPVSWRPWVVVK